MINPYVFVFINCYIKFAAGMMPKSINVYCCLSSSNSFMFNICDMASHDQCESEHNL